MEELILNFDMIDKILQKVGFYNFDPSDVEFIVAGYSMNDFTRLSIVPTQKRITIQGIDKHYHTYAKIPHYYRISFDVLPVCKDLQVIEELNMALEEMDGSFDVVIKSQGRFLGTFKCYFEVDSSDILSEEATDKTYEMVAIKLEEGIRQTSLGEG
ncbi:tail tube protein [Acinetobacter phage vB_AbaM_P1]|nr:hypothetical protein vBAbaMD22_31 [Acinetobacter phage vB_AbaM_D22]UJE34839.1 tail tube protein [Acinetobacter phage vB_AbaM_P1]WAX22705.1 fiber protein [Acinetobacter phage vB_AbaP_HB01]